MSISLTYDGTLSRVRVTGAVPGLLDTFARTAASSWGTSDSGEVWVTSGGSASDYSVGSGVGTLSLGTVNVYRSATTTSTHTDVDFQATFGVDVLITGAECICELAARRVDASNEYYARMSIDASQNVNLLLRKRVGGTVTTVGTYATGLLHTTTSKYHLRLSVVGTALKAKLWATSEGEPDWQLEVTDSALSQAAVQVVRAVLASGNTNSLPVAVTVDDVIGRGDAVVERSTDEITWTTVRGGTGLDGTTGAAVLVDDYEFVPNVENHYRVRRLEFADADSITPTMDSVWIKNLARPFLNRAVAVIEWAPVMHAARNAVLPIIGRRDPIAMSDVRMGKRWELVLWATTADEADELVQTFASGEPVFVHVPGPDCPVPGGYATVGDISVTKGSASRSPSRRITLPMTQVAAPGPDVIGATMTWQTVISSYATWADVIAANATWQDLLDGIADPDDVVVG